MWNTYSQLLEEVMHDSSSSLSGARPVGQAVRDLQSILAANFSDIRKRNEALLFRDPIPQVSARLGTAVADVKVRPCVWSKLTDLSLC